MRACEKVGGYLAQPQTQEQMEFLHGLAEMYAQFTGVYNWWLGLTDVGHEGIWEWNHTMEEVTETFWAAGSPNTEDGNILDCGSIHLYQGNLLWRDVDCSASMDQHGAAISPVCQRGNIDPDDKTTPTMTAPTMTAPTTKTTKEMTSTTTHPIVEDCPYLWSRFDKSCYIYNYNQYATWISARENCQRMNPSADLASSNSEAENEFLWKFSDIWNAHGGWLGGSDSHVEGEWVWTDGSSFNYTNWDSSSPDGGLTKNCMYMHSSHSSWTDENCDQIKKYFCEFSLE